MARYVVGVAALLAAVLAPLGLTAGFSPLVATLDLAVLGVVLVYGSPWLLPLLRTTRRPTGAVADRLDALRERAGLDVRDVRVLDTDDQETATTVVRGPPGYRRLFVSTTFLDCFDDDTAAALLAVDAGRVRAHTLPVRVATVFVAGLALVASVTGAGLRWPLLGVALGVVLAGFWLSRRAIRAADDYAAVRVGPDALAAALERYAEVHAMEPTRRRLPNPLSVNVALGDRLDREPAPDVPLGVNVGKSKSTPLEDAADDYRYTYERVGAHADYVAVNVSSPNTPGLRSLQNRESLERILGTLSDAGADPLLVKFSPDLPEPAVEEALSVVDDLGLDGVIATNTTTDRPDTLRSPQRAERGGLSGKPIEARATSMVRFIAERTDVPVVGVGGVSDAAGAYAKIRNGASLVQLYTGLVYEGPSVARDINEGLAELLERDGFDSVADAVGADL